ncbi:MAG: PAS domain-containing protein, partial [Comamonas sp.]|nr:PAS domain-containing protein [Comamonas sp.]
MQRAQRQLLLAATVAALGLGLWLLITLGLAALALPPALREQWQQMLASVSPLLVLAWVLGSAGLLAVWRRWVQPAQHSLAQLAEHTRVAISHRGKTFPANSYAPAHPLHQAIADLIAQRDSLRNDMDEQVRQTSGRLQQEKERLAALLAELPQCVLVCNLEGRILLYNQLAQQQLGKPQQGASIGIGRSIEGLLERQLVEHALQRVAQQVERGAANPASHFITHTQAQQLLRVQMSPVLSHAAAPSMTGFVLLLDDVTHSFAQEAERDHLLHSLTEGNRASLAAIRAAVEMLGYDDIPAAMRQRFLDVVQEETTRMGERIDTLAQRAAQEVNTRWPLEDMQGEDFLTAAQHHLHSQLQRPVQHQACTPDLWLRVDGYSLLQALAYLGQRLVQEYDVPQLHLRLQAADGQRAHLDLVWSGQAMSTETVMSWEMDNLEISGERSTLTVRDIVTRHDGELWFERDRASHTGFLRFLLPLGHAQTTPNQTTPNQSTPNTATNTAASPSAPALHLGSTPIDSRPEFYDFDLFQHQEPDSDLDDRPLSSLRYTVFDTETTGLNPSQGDQIIQIGAVRIVNARLLAQESFDQLIHPGRDIPEAGIPIHGITPDMVANQPRIEAVLPQFHRFAQDSVLVAHNAAFDMKFLQLLEKRTGVEFRQPVLDTLLLSAVAHPHQDSHRLEALAERFGVTIFGRHTGL